MWSPVSRRIETSNVGVLPLPGRTANISGNVTDGGAVNLYGGNNVSGSLGTAPGSLMAITGSLTDSGTVNVMSGLSLLADGATLSVSGNLTNSGDIEVLSGASVVAYGGTLGVSGTLTNSGKLHVGGIGMGAPFDGTAYVNGTSGMTNSGTVQGGCGRATPNYEWFHSRREMRMWTETRRLHRFRSTAERSPAGA